MSKAIKGEFLQLMKNENSLDLLFETIPDIYFWIKNHKFQFVMGNQALLELCRARSLDEIIGKTDDDFFPREMCRKFRRDDRKILEGAPMIRNRIEIIPNRDGEVNWYSTNKVPLHSRLGRVIGIAGTTRRIKNENFLCKPEMEFSQVFNHIRKHFSRPIEVRELASLECVSLSQFENKFKKVFQLTPIKFIIYFRIKEACKMLISTEEPLSVISQSIGFYDQSTFSKHFKNALGILPSEYRRIYANKR